MYPIGGKNELAKNSAGPSSPDPGFPLVRVNLEQTTDSLLYQPLNLAIEIIAEGGLSDENGGGTADEEDQGDADEEAGTRGTGADETKAGDTAVGTRCRWGPQSLTGNGT